MGATSRGWTRPTSFGDTRTQRRSPRPRKAHWEIRDGGLSGNQIVDVREGSSGWNGALAIQTGFPISWEETVCQEWQGKAFVAPGSETSMAKNGDKNQIISKGVRAMMW